MNRQTKLKLVEKLNNEFENLLSQKQRANYASYMRAINEEVIEKVPKTKKQVREIVKKHQVDTTVAAKMFTVLSGVENYLLNDPTRKSRKLLKPLEPIMRVYNVRSPKTFAQGIYDMTAGRNTSERSKRFKPALLSYYDGFTENIESLEKQNQRALQRTEVEKASQVFKDLEDLREARVPIREAKKILLEKYNDPVRVTRALNTELHEQAERTKLEQSKFMGYTHKRWNTQGDEKVRRTAFHNSVNGKVVPIDSVFKGGGQVAEYPSDVTLDVGERINCRCFITYHNEPQAKISTRPVITPPRPTAPPSRPIRPRRFQSGGTAEEALSNIRKLNPKVETDISFRNVADQEFTRSATNRIGELMDRFNLTDRQLTLRRDITTKNVDGSCSTPVYGSDINYQGQRISNNYITFNVSKSKKDSSGKTRERVIDELKEGIESNFHVPIDEKNLYDYTSIHEFGHFVHMNGIGNNPNLIKKVSEMRKGFSEETEKGLSFKSLFDVDDGYNKVLETRLSLDQKIDGKENINRIIDERNKLLTRSDILYKSIANVLRMKTVEKIMEKRNISFAEATDIVQNETSRYGKQNVHEWFAETFTEYIGSSKPREHAAAFGEVLEEVFNADS